MQRVRLFIDTVLDGFLIVFLIAVTVFLSFGLAAAIRKSGLGSGDAAGWVQAIGSIVGIGVAIYLPYRQRRLEKNDKDLAYWEDKYFQAHRLRPLAQDTHLFLQRLFLQATPSPDGHKVVELDIRACSKLSERTAKLFELRLGISEQLTLEMIEKLLIDLQSRFATVRHVPPDALPDPLGLKALVVQSEGIVHNVRVLADKAADALRNLRA